MSTGRKLRIAALLLILAFVAGDAWLTRTRSTSWDRTLRATIYPIVADGRATTREYVAGLRAESFADIEAFIAREARRYGIGLVEPLRVRLGPVLDQLPPLPPAGRSLPGTVAWSLQLRWWANRREAAQPRPRSQIRLFVIYYDPATTPHVAHSLGLKEGLIGVVHAFASARQAPTNNFVIAHELLHTLGATDKYDFADGRPLFPDGYADPTRVPRFPQEAAEVMAGRIPLSERRAEIPDGLPEVVAGPATAREIGWLAEK